MQIAFSKMHGLGNDFMVINNIDQAVRFNPSMIQRWSDRHRGIGFDQLLVIEPAVQSDVDFTYRIYNADGGEVGQCGNGARCLARYIQNKGLSTRNPLQVQTQNDRLTLTCLDDGNVEVALAIPRFAPEAIPTRLQATDDHYTIAYAGYEFTCGAVNLGNPHAVIAVSDLDSVSVTGVGQFCQVQGDFPEGVNVGFMQVLAPDHIRLRVYERGVGETLACGSGAAAAVVVGIRWGLLADTTRVDLPGGAVSVSWSGDGHPVVLTGPAEHVFDGVVEIE